MTVRYRRDREAWYVDVVVNLPDGTWERIRARSPINTKRAAQEYERKLVEETLARATNPSPEERRFDEFAEDFMKTYATANNKPSEVDSKRRILDEHLLPTFGSLLLGQVTTYEVERYKAAKLSPPQPRGAIPTSSEADGTTARPRKPLAPKTVRNHLAVLGKILRTAQEWGFLANVPRIKQVKASLPKPDFLDFDEADRLVEGGDGDWRTMILVALRTGMRLGELRALRWDDVDLVAGRVVVRYSAWEDVVGTPKTDRTREIPLSDDARKALKSHRRLGASLVFCDKQGEMLPRDTCNWPLWRACRRAGLRQVGWHVLRHSFASQLVMSGRSLKEVQELLGHTSITMTMRYAHLAPNVLRDAVQVLDRRSTWHQDGTRTGGSSATGGNN